MSLIGYCIKATLQELKLQSIKICDGVVFSRYSRIIRFTNKLTIFCTFTQSLQSSMVERQTCNWENGGLNPGWGTNSLLVYHLLYCFKATSAEISFSGLNCSQFLAVQRARQALLLHLFHLSVYGQIMLRTKTYSYLHMRSDLSMSVVECCIRTSEFLYNIPWPITAKRCCEK